MFYFIFSKFNKPSGDDRVMIKEKKLGIPKYIFKINDPETHYTITNDNRVIIKNKKMKQLDPGMNYTMNILPGKILVSQSICSQMYRRRDESAASIGWDFRVGPAKGTSSSGTKASSSKTESSSSRTETSSSGTETSSSGTGALSSRTGTSSSGTKTSSSRTGTSSSRTRTSSSITRTSSSGTETSSSSSSASLSSSKIKKDVLSGKHPKQLSCGHQHMQFHFKPNFKKGIEIKKVRMSHDSCKLSYNNTHGYYITTSYTECGTTMHENDKHIVFKNIVRISFINKNTTNRLIERVFSYNIGLECHFNKSYVNTIKGKREGDDGIVVTAQSVQIDEYSRSNSSFAIQFQVYKSSQYKDSYGTEEFPIYLAITRRMYFEIALTGDDFKVIPLSCWATKERSYLSQPRYYMIKDRCPQDGTYQKHGDGNKKFQYSIEAFNFKDGSDSIYIHCESFVCSDKKDPNCQFGCKNGISNSRNKRSIEETTSSFANNESYMTSTLEIKIKNQYKVTANQKMQNDEQEDDEDGIPSSVIYMQIPIALIIIAIIAIAWRCMKKRRLIPNTKIDDAKLLQDADL